MKDKYETWVSQFCGKNWKTSSREDRDSGLGIACVCSYLLGTSAIVESIANDIGVEEEEIEDVMERLEDAGVFSGSCDARNDPALNGDEKDREFRMAWGYVGGIASGLVFRPASPQEKQEPVVKE